MAISPKPYDSVWAYLRDVGLAFVITLGGIIFAGAIVQPFRNVTDLAYPIALCLGLAPLHWFTRRCQMHDWDWYDYAALSVFIVLTFALRSALGGANQRMMETVIIGLAFGCFLGGWTWIRAKFRRDAQP